MIKYLVVVLGVRHFNYFFFLSLFFFLFLNDGIGRGSLYLGYTFWYRVGG